MDFNVRLTYPTLWRGKVYAEAYLDEALEKCAQEGKRALNMPELIQNKTAAPWASALWQWGYFTQSAQITGRTKAGTPIVLYIHDETQLDDATYLRPLRGLDLTYYAIRGLPWEQEGLHDGAAPMSTEIFNRLEERVGDGKVFAVDHARLHAARSGIMQRQERESTEEFYTRILAHPQTIPFMGVSEKDAMSYLIRLSEWSAELRSFGIHYSNDLRDQPLGRKLFLNWSAKGIDSQRHLDSCSGDQHIIGVEGFQPPLKETYTVTGNVVDGGLVDFN